MTIKAYPSKNNQAAIDGLSIHPTGQPIREKQHGLDVSSHEFVRVVGTDTVEAASSTTVLNLTSHAALVGDVIRFTSGALVGQEVKVGAVATNTVSLVEVLGSDPSTLTIQILRHKYPVVNADGTLGVSSSADYSYAEDSAQTPGDNGAHLLSVRQDTLASSVDTDGDYASVKSNAKGEVYIKDADALVELQSLSGTVSGSELQVDVVTSALPTGASTAANQATEIASLSSIETDASTIAGAISGSEMQVDIVTSALPTGAATSALQTTGNAILTTIDTSLNNIEASLVEDVGEFARNDYSSTNVTTGAYVQLVASTSNTYTAVEIFDSSGQTLYLAIGAAAVEVDKMLIFPGGNGKVSVAIPSGSRVSLKAVSATASEGEISVNFIG